MGGLGIQNKRIIGILRLSGVQNGNNRDLKNSEEFQEETTRDPENPKGFQAENKGNASVPNVREVPTIELLQVKDSSMGTPGQHHFLFGIHRAPISMCGIPRDSCHAFLGPLCGVPM